MNAVRDELGLKKFKTHANSGVHMLCSGFLASLLFHP